MTERDRGWVRTCIIVALLGYLGGFALAMLLVGSGNWGEFWIRVANFGA